MLKPPMGNPVIGYSYIIIRVGHGVGQVCPAPLGLWCWTPLRVTPSPRSGLGEGVHWPELRAEGSIGPYLAEGGQLTTTTEAQNSYKWCRAFMAVVSK